jgi:hypothetical protein
MQPEKLQDFLGAENGGRLLALFIFVELHTLSRGSEPSTSTPILLTAPSMNSNAMPQERITETGQLLLSDNLLNLGEGFDHGVAFDLLVFSPPEPV